MRAHQDTAQDKSLRRIKAGSGHFGLATVLADTWEIAMRRFVNWTAPPLPNTALKDDDSALTSELWAVLRKHLVEHD